MLTFNQPKLEIVRCDNGYIVEWQKEPTGLNETGRGVRIVATKEELLKYVDSFFYADRRGKSK